MSLTTNQRSLLGELKQLYVDDWRGYDEPPNYLKFLPTSIIKLARGERGWNTLNKLVEKGYIHVLVLKYNPWYRGGTSKPKYSVDRFNVWDFKANLTSSALRELVVKTTLVVYFTKKALRAKTTKHIQQISNHGVFGANVGILNRADINILQPTNIDIQFKKKYNQKVYVLEIGDVKMPWGDTERTITEDSLLLLKRKHQNRER